MLAINWEFTFILKPRWLSSSERFNPHFCSLKVVVSYFDGLTCVYISHLTFFSLGACCRRQDWKCRVGATDHHAITLWPHSFTSRQTGRVKTGPSLIWRKAVSVRVTWVPRENAVWMTDISLLSASINHNSKNSHFLQAFCFFSIFFNQKNAA